MNHTHLVKNEKTDYSDAVQRGSEGVFSKDSYIKQATDSDRNFDVFSNKDSDYGLRRLNVRKTVYVRKSDH